MRLGMEIVAGAGAEAGVEGGPTVGDLVECMGMALKRSQLPSGPAPSRASLDAPSVLPWSLNPPLWCQREG